MKTTTPTTEGTKTQEQVNLSYGSVEKLKSDTSRIYSLFAAGTPVWIGRNGYGTSQYAVLNVQRWHRVHGYYNCQCEFNGDLPKGWRDAILKIIS